MDKFKTISSIGLIGLVGLIAYLFWQVGQLKDNRANQVQEINRLEWLLSAKEAENDSIKNIGVYSKPDTVWRTRVRIQIDTVSGKVDTVYEDIVGDIAKIKGVILIDTTKEFGPESNRLSIHVSGKFYYPEEYGHRNWLKIVPSFRNAPYLPSKPSKKNWSMHLNYSRSFNGGDGRQQSDYFGASLGYKRFLLSSGYDPWHRTALMTVGFDIWGF